MADQARLRIVFVIERGAKNLVQPLPFHRRGIRLHGLFVLFLDFSNSGLAQKSLPGFPVHSTYIGLPCPGRSSRKP